jgi:magnesium-transporting ATPase (P-type)
MSRTAPAPLSADAPHSLTTGEVLDAVESSTEGLSAGEAHRRLAEGGPNRLPSPKREGVLRRFFKHFDDVLIYVLLAAAAVTAALQHWLDASVILAVVVANATIGFVQEGKAEEALAGIRQMLSPHATVRREGAWADVDAEELVPGDVVRLRAGDRVPADIRLLEATNLRIEESALTGESVPASKGTDPVPAEAGVGDRQGMAHSGSLVTTGQGIGVVTATGAATEIGRISSMIADVETLDTPLTQQMTAFGRRLSLAILVLAVVMFGVGLLLHDYPMEELFFAAIGFAVAAIPEGLPAILTITLAIGVQRMARRNAITRRLPAVETLGSVTVICSDKTGTLTRNEMTARHVVTAGGRFDAEGTGYAPEGAIELEGSPVSPADRPDLHAVVEVMAVCNDAQVHQEEGRWVLTGEPTEGALRALALKAGVDTGGYQRVAVVPFESEHKLMATLDLTPEGERQVFVKGAPDRLLDRCSAQIDGQGAVAPLDRAYWEQAVDDLGNEGLRVLAAARRDAPATGDDLSLEDLDEGLVLCGLVGIVDPPRPEAIDAIETSHRAGIQVKMITGDHAGTAAAIAREMGIGDGARVLSGAELEAADDDELRDLVAEHDVFARTSPEHKLRIVTALQANDEVVAMTGDGVNDAPALKRADVGVAMGIKGTEATKEAAEIVLADDNFASIERAVEEGRTIYDNIRKAIAFILPTNGAEALVVLVAVVLGLTLPLTPVQILWINMVSAVTLALALGFEPPEAGLMERPPRRPGSSILDPYLLWRIGFVTVLMGAATVLVFIAADEGGRSLAEARTLALNTLVFGEIFYLLNSRFMRASSLRPRILVENRAVAISIGVLLGLQLLYVYAPFMHRLFGSAALGAQEWLVAVGIGLGLFVVVEVEKAVARRRA